MTFPEPPENLSSDAAVAEVRARLVADGVIPAPMPDQTPEPLTSRKPSPFSDEELKEFATGLTTASNSYAAVQDLSTKLVAARARLEEQQREVNLLAIQLGEARGLHTKAADELAQARGWARWFAAERDESRADAGAARGSAMAYRARVMELQSQVAARDARIAEPEAAQANRSEIPNGSAPDAYIAVKRYHAVSADGPEWCDDAAVIPAGHIHAWEREDHLKRGYQLLPIVADGNGTRFAATPPTRCQATTASPLIDDRRSLWCELPTGHAGMHHAAVPQPGFPATEVDWDDTEEAGR